MRPELTHEPDYPLSVLVAYDDHASGFRAKEMLESLKAKLQLEKELIYFLWKFDLLRNPKLRSNAAAQANEADILLVAAHEDRELDDSVKEWLENWCCARPERPQALAYLASASTAKAGTETPLCTYLRGLAQSSQADFFCNLAEPGADSAIELEPILHGWQDPAPYLHWGIND